MYLTALKKGKIEPNFWCSREYFTRAGWVEYTKGGVVYVADNEEELMLPPLHEDGFFVSLIPPRRIWSDMTGFCPNDMTSHFLDFEFLYQASSFQTMEGGNWATFRKNTRKWPGRQQQGWRYAPGSLLTIPDLNDLLVSWLEGVGEDTVIQDANVIENYLHHGHFRKALVTDDGVIRAINIWDHNHRFINYRYCICRPEAHLSDFARWMFYNEIYHNCGGVIVNDGGCLDRADLYAYKQNLNPFAVRRVHSWK